MILNYASGFSALAICWKISPTAGSQPVFLCRSARNWKMFAMYSIVFLLSYNTTNQLINYRLRLFYEVLIDPIKSIIESGLYDMEESLDEFV